MNPSSIMNARFWVCGDSRAELFSLNADPYLNQPLWAWDANTAPGLPPDRRPLFRELDEVKPVLYDGQPCLLLTASYAGGVALVRQSDGACLFCAPLINAHSADLLPGGWIVTAASIGTDALHAYHLNDGPAAIEPCAQLPMQHAHGVVFDRRRQIVWACGATRLFKLRLEPEPSPAFQLLTEIPLPDRSAHDLSADPATGNLLLTTAAGVWQVNPQTHQITPFPPLATMLNVKAVSVNASTGQIAFQKGEAGHWWSDTLYFLGPDNQLQMRCAPQRKLYKVRWDQNLQL